MTQLSYGYGGERQYELYYRHSNRVPVVGLLLGGLAGVAAGLVLAVAYSYAIIFIPIIYANLASCAGFGFALGWVPARVMREFKVRSVPVVLAAVGVIALIAYYFHWVVWIHAILNQHQHQADFLTVLTNPVGMVRVIAIVYEKGTWGMTSHSDPTTGPILALVWLVEAAGIFGIAFTVARRVQTDTPFCEACDAWCAPGVKVRSLPWGSADELKRRMENKDWAYFDVVGDSARSAAAWFGVIHHKCRFCNSLHTLSAKSYAVSTDRNGRVTVKEKHIVQKLLVTPEEVEFVCRPRGAGVVAGVNETAIPTAQVVSNPLVLDEMPPGGQ